jgi:drug/metabolite transporter (DMT)-like permease
VSRGLVYMAGAAFFFSLMSLQVKIAGATLPLGEIVFARALVTLSISYTVLRISGIPMWGNNKRLLILRGVFGFLALNAFYYSVMHLPLAEATVLHFMSPVFTALLAAFVLHERLGLRELLGSLLSLTGVIVFAAPASIFGGPPTAMSPGAIVVGLLAAVCSALAYSTVRELRRTDDPNVIVFYFPLIALPGSAPLLLLDARWPVGNEWLLLLGIGVTTQIAQMFLTRAIHLEPAGRVTSVSYLQILFAATWSALIFGQFPTGHALLGMLLVVLGTTIVVARRGVAEPAISIETNGRS